MECEVEKNKEHCNCTYSPCPHKGKCCECIVRHQKRDELPACFFPDEVEKTYDRSIERFIACYSE